MSSSHFLSVELGLDEEAELRLGEDGIEGEVEESKEETLSTIVDSVLGSGGEEELVERKEAEPGERGTRGRPVEVELELVEGVDLRLGKADDDALRVVEEGGEEVEDDVIVPRTLNC